MAIIEWVKKNKLSTVLILLVLYFVYKYFFGVSIQRMAIPQMEYKVSDVAEGVVPQVGLGAPAPGAGNIALPSTRTSEYTPQTDVKDRLVTQESSISLLVKDVVSVRNKILEHASAIGGYMVNVYTSSPEEAPSATIMVRVPSDKLQESLDYFNSLSVKVVSENLVGHDVTDEYVDIDKRIETYEKTKAKYEEILDRATIITEITNLTREIINIQTLIDSLKGRQEALKQNADLAKITIYISTDEIALPYAPSETFRPQVIFKLAVRSLVRFLRGMATWAIWLGVYAVIWVPALLIYFFLRKWWEKKKTTI